MRCFMTQRPATQMQQPTTATCLSLNQTYRERDREREREREREGGVMGGQYAAAAHAPVARRAARADANRDLWKCMR